MGLKHLRQWTLAALTLVALAPSARADDLNVNGAWQRYQSQQTVADQAKAASDAAAQRLSLLQSQLNDAQYAVSRAQSDVSNAQSTLDNLNRQISDLQADSRNVTAQVGRDQQSLDDAQRRFGQARRQQQQAQQQVQHSEHELNDLQDELKHLQNSNAPDRQIEQKKQQIEHQQQEVDRARSRLDRASSDLRDSETQVNELTQRVANEQTQIQADADQITNLGRQHDQTLLDLGSSQARLTQAQGDVTSVGRQVALGQSDANAAFAAANQQQTLANQSYAYYQQVKSNYDRALAAVYATADQAAARDGVREAQERAAIPGGADGQRAGQDQGHAKGETDGDARDKVVGYRDGRKNGATNAAVAAAYARGQADGQNDATAKARAEDYPRGYNDALSQRLGAAPSQAATLDVTDTLPDDAGGAGPTLSTNPKAVSSKAAPAYSLPADQTLTPPAYRTPGFSVPARDNRYAAAPCDNLVLAEFTPLCRTRYDQSYQSRYDAAYRSTYLSGYASAYNQAAADAYNQALQDVHTETYTAAQNQGAHDQGELDGFAAALPNARTAQYQAGQAQLAADFAGGHLLILRSVEVAETNGDGIVSPDEFATLRVVVDNYGGQASPKGKLRLRLTDKTGIETATFETRDLPALAADTRTTLVGLTRLKPAQVAAGTTVKASGLFETQSGSGYQAVNSFSVNQVVHYPVEMTGLQMAKVPAVGEAVKTTLTFKNTTNAQVPATPAVLWSSPVVVTAADSGKLQVPALEPGATVTVDVNVTPTYYVGENTNVPLLLTTQKEDGKPWLVQPFPVPVHLNRDAALLLYDTRGQAVTTSTFNVPAGGRVGFGVGFKFFATQSRGPFTITATKTSDPGITTASGSTTGVQLGYWSPGTTMPPTWMYFDVNAKLKGKQGWVMVQLLEGNTNIHVMMVYLNVQ